MLLKLPNYQLDKKVIDIWLCQLSDLENKNALFLEQLSTEEQARSARFKFAIHRNRFISSHGFMRTVLANYLHIRPQQIEYKKGDQGKPSLANPEAGLIEFNLSHTEDLAILAISKASAVGIDIEHNDRKTDWQGICKRFFTVSEQDALSVLPEEAQGRAFFDLWTRKEAYMKVLGTGLSLSPTEFTLSVYPQAPKLIHHHSTKFPALEKVGFAMIDLSELLKTLENYSATLAVAEENFTHQLYQFTA
ncbi:4'-phosphopantetheinyl transferase family protein [sulfur-oxidizing endosymbiont of Gigantopelta aegis]|uniref:4'-phosphopantetheinyl transferase family protein n=1 Tax=sulfur-oxidizing endosymbiont of Gigantopelta aegis TaxID=2794934 RepID=UPI0018DD5598|nr:4'-phosphopantetheinyl transferase superfamily protein [sulfur-oxidizing endosymbiont of Gigantopelta aegis]